jgi:hypothetical protein
MKTHLFWSAWRNGDGSSVGLKVPVRDREQHFNHAWKSVFLTFPEETHYGEIEINIDKPSFWNDTCHELINKSIKEWLTSLGLLPWSKGHPPKVIIELLGERRFAIRGVQNEHDSLDDQREQKAVLRYSMKQATKAAQENPY